MYLAHAGYQSKLWFGGVDSAYVRAALASTIPEAELNLMSDSDLE